MPDPEFILLGDAIWLDFVNTGEGRTPDAADRLSDGGAYHRWSKAEKLSSDVDTVAWPDVLDFREILRALASALGAGRQATASSVELINNILSRSEGHDQLTRTGGNWQLRFTPRNPTLASDAIARSVAGTLTDPAKKVRRCSADGCTLFYIDESPDQTRSWCSVEPCGQRSQVERRRSLR